MCYVLSDGMTALSCACSRVECPWAVNFGVVQPGGGPLTAVVGDAPQGLLLDWTTGKVMPLSGSRLIYRVYSPATAVVHDALQGRPLDWTTGKVAT